MAVTISRQTARRYVLGRQGLWPGRRWSELEGTELALRNCECVQIDTISAVARSHELHLLSRVDGDEPAMLDRLMYQDRRFFDFGSILMVYPSDEMPYWRAVMRWQRERHAPALQARLPVVEHVRQELSERGPLASRDFKNRERVPGGFNMMKDSAIALYYLWIGGEIVTHSRRGFDRVYELASRYQNGKESNEDVGDAEARQFFACKAMRDLGIATASEWSRRVRVYMHRVPDIAPAKILQSLADTGILVPIELEGDPQSRWALAEDVPILAELEAGRVPEAWKPIGPTTAEEVNFLAPLDNVIWDRARTKAVFDFDYIWEVYKPASIRRWGYYTLPILWGDKLAARLAPRMNRKTKTLVLEGYWPENEKLSEEPAFVMALSAGLRRFANFHGAETVMTGPLAALLGPEFKLET